MLPYLFIFLNILFGIFVLYFIIAFVSGAPFVPTADPVARKMIELSGVKKDQIVYDLGSGDGKLLYLAAKEGARAIGIEINPILVFYARLRQLFLRVPGSMQTKWGNFWGNDVKNADIVYVYLLPWRMDALARKLERELKKGAVVVSNSFIFPKWKLLREDRDHHVYVYQIS